MYKRLFLACALLIGAITSLWADSPLTSTHFWRIYKVTEAGSHYFEPYKTVDKAGWGETVMSMLITRDLTLEQRLCIVNYLGWDFNGQTHYRDLLKYYCRQNNKRTGDDIFRDMPADMITVFAYVRAMDNYFDVSEALKLARMAQEKAPQSKAVAMMTALIGAQAAMDSNWGEVYRLCHAVEVNRNLKNDFCDAAVAAIMEYINSYAEYDNP